MHPSRVQCMLRSCPLPREVYIDVYLSAPIRSPCKSLHTHLRKQASNMYHMRL